MGDTTDRIELLRGVKKAQFEINKRFYESARRHAERLISAKVKSRVSATEVANSAMRHMLQLLDSGDAPPMNSEQFQILLHTVVQFKTLNRIKAARRQKRDVNLEQVFDEQYDSPDPATNELTADVIDRLAARVLVHLLKSYEKRTAEGPNIPQYILALRIAFGCSGTSIRDALLEFFPNMKGFARRTIELQNAKDEAAFLRFLMEESGNADEEETEHSANE